MIENRFEHFLAIDWSGAKGERQKGIALALTHADGGPPVLVNRQRAWAREEVLAILLDLPDNTLVGMDLGISLPFVDCGAFFPEVELDDSPTDAKSLWRSIDLICSYEDHFGASDFVDHPYFARYFRHSGLGEGDMFRCDGAGHGSGRFRAAELAQRAMGCRPVSNFNLVGAAQVGKSSLTGMRMLHRLEERVPVWPIDPLPQTGSVIVEIYTALALMEAWPEGKGRKLRTIEDLNVALGGLDSPHVSGSGPIDDHSSDALITAAWLRKVAPDPARWAPDGLTPEIARTEGWTFGAY